MNKFYPVQLMIDDRSFNPFVINDVDVQLLSLSGDQNLVRLERNPQLFGFALNQKADFTRAFAIVYRSTHQTLCVLRQLLVG